MFSILSETKGKENLSVEKLEFSFDTTETADNTIKQEAFIGSNDVKFPFARGEN